MPIHKELDLIGISHHIKNGTFDKEIYGKWLLVTYQFLIGYELLMDSQEGIDASIAHFSPPSLGLHQLREDLKQLYGDILLPSALNFPPIDTPLLTVVPVYTLLGSLMGSNMIYLYVQKLSSELPTIYLKHVLQYKSNWKSFLEHLAQLEASDSLTDLATYTAHFWGVIHESYLSTFVNNGSIS